MLAIAYTAAGTTSEKRMDGKKCYALHASFDLAWPLTNGAIRLRDLRQTYPEPSWP
jgi:hypothetical protein